MVYHVVLYGFVKKKRSYTVPTGDMKMTNMGHSNEPGAHFRTEQSYMVVMLASQLGIYFRASLETWNRGDPVIFHRLEAHAGGPNHLVVWEPIRREV